MITQVGSVQVQLVTINSTWSDDSHEFYLDLDGDKELESNEIITKKYVVAVIINLQMSYTWNLHKLRVRFQNIQVVIG